MDKFWTFSFLAFLFIGNAHAQQDTQIPESKTSKVEVIQLGEQNTKVYIARFDLNDPNLRPMILKAGDDLFTGKPVDTIASTLTTSNQQYIAVNGDFFEEDFSPTGMLAIDGELWKGPASLPDSDGLPRSVFAFNEVGEIYIGRPKIKITLRDEEGNSLEIDRVNFPETHTESVIYSHRIGDRTPSLLRDQFQVRIGLGFENAVMGIPLDSTSTGVVLGFGPGPTSVLAPNQVVLHLPKPYRDWIRKNKRITLTTELEGIENATNILGGLPALILDGKADPVQFAKEEDFPEQVTVGAYPRTAIGYDSEKNELIVLVTDGYLITSGLTLQEVADWFLEQGCDQALNLDGGSSSTLVENGRLLNDPGNEPPAYGGFPAQRMNDPRNPLSVGSALVFKTNSN